MPLGYHLILATWEEILGGEFVDVFSLLFQELENKAKEVLEDRDKERLHCNRAYWLPGKY